MKAVATSLIAGCAWTFAACYEDLGTSLRETPVFRAYAAERVYHCTVPFYSNLSPDPEGHVQVYDGADLVLRVNGVAELTFYSRFGFGDDTAGWQADTLQVRGTYERDGFVLRFRFDEGYAQTLPMDGELLEGGRLVTAFPDGGNMEFVPVEQRPAGEPAHCQP